MDSGFIRKRSGVLHLYGYSVPFIKELLDYHFESISISTNTLSKGHLIYTGISNFSAPFIIKVRNRLLDLPKACNMDSFFNKASVAASAELLKDNGLKLDYILLLFLGYQYMQKDFVNNSYQALVDFFNENSKEGVTIDSSVARGLVGTILSQIESYTNSNGTILDVSKFLDFVLLDDLDEDCELKYKFLRLFCAEYVGINDKRRLTKANKSLECYTTYNGRVFGKINDEYRDIVIKLIRNYIQDDLNNNLDQVHNSSLYRAVDKLINSHCFEDEYYVPCLFAFSELVLDILKVEIPPQANDSDNNDMLKYIRDILSLREVINHKNFSGKFKEDNDIVLERKHCINSLKYDVITSGWVN